MSTLDEDELELSDLEQDKQVDSFRLPVDNFCSSVAEARMRRVVNSDLFAIHRGVDRSAWFTPIHLNSSIF